MASSSIVSSNVNSLYIPIINSFVNEDFVKHSFDVKNIATIERVDFVFNNAKGRREAFVHILTWKDGKDSTKMKNSLIKKNNYKFYFHLDNKSMFWPLLINKNPLSIDSPNRVSTNNYTIEERVNTMTQHLNALQSIALNHSVMLQEMNVEENTSNKRQRSNEEKYNNDYIPPAPQIVRQNASSPLLD